MSTTPVPDWILLDVAVHSSTGARLAASSIGVTGGRVSFLGDAPGGGDSMGPRTRVLRAPGLHVYPGLADAHGHVASLGRRLEEVDLGGTRTLPEALERIRMSVAERSPESWITGSGWDESNWPEGRLPTAADLEPVVGGRPAYFPRKDFHSAWVSSRALSLAGITSASRDPEGGKIVRDVTGQPSGIVVDRAMTLVERMLPKAGEEALLQRVRAAEDAVLAAGLTSVHDMGVDRETLAALRRLDREGKLRLRVYAALEDDPDLWEDELDQKPQSPDPGGRLQVQSVKLFIDGSLGSKSAAMLEDYEGEPGNRGLLVLTPAELEEKLTRALRAGFRICVHAIGDRGNRVVLDVLETISARGSRSPRALRPRIEHAQSVHAADVERFASLGVVASMQPIHCASDMELATAYLGAERSREAYAWRSFVRVGVPLAFGSDFPVESYDPRLGLFAAITRQRPDGRPRSGWHPEQRLTLPEALDAYTRGPAFAAFAESERGEIALGMKADLTILDRELSAEDPAGILSARVAATVVDGKVEYAADAAFWGG